MPVRRRNRVHGEVPDNPRHSKSSAGRPHGNAVHLGERDARCSAGIRRSSRGAGPGHLGPRAEAARSACATACRPSTTGGSHVEFLYQDGNFYFTRMNTPHPGRASGDRARPGIDLVKMRSDCAGRTHPQAIRDGGSTGTPSRMPENAEDPVTFTPNPQDNAISCTRGAGSGSTAISIPAIRPSD